MDHLPASSTVPTPLKFLGRIVGTPGELTYAKDIHRYLEAVAKASGGRAKFWTIGKTEEGRDMVLMAIADEATIASARQVQGDAARAHRPAEDERGAARSSCIKTAKPIYWVTSGMHSPETGGPEMLMELAYRLVVEETPFIQNIRNNVITFITPVIEVDGREKHVDTYYFNKKRAAGEARLPLMYWGKYVQHDNNRDGMGQFLDLTKNIDEDVPRVDADDHARPARGADVPVRLHRHRPVQRAARPDHRGRVVDAGRERRDGDDEARRAGRLDLRLLRRLGAELHVLHRALAQRGGALLRGAELRPRQLRGAPGATTTSREWFRPNPPLATINWGPRNNTNIQESALLLSLSHVAKNRTLFLENYWLKNKRSVDKGRTARRTRG